MQSRRLVLLVLFWVAACGPAQQSDSGDDAALRELTASWDVAANAQDADGLLALYDDNAVRMSANVPVAVGKDAIRASFLEEWELNDVTVTNDVADVRVSGNLAGVRGTWTASVTPKNGAEPYEDRGTWTSVYQRQPDESWTSLWDIWNSELPPRPGQAAPTWAEDHLSAWFTAYNAGDAEAVAELYWPEAVRIPPDGAPLRGRAAIQASLADEFRTTQFECRGGYSDVREMGAMAVTTGHDSCDATPKAGGTSDARSSRWTAVFEQRGTEWLIAYETWEDIDGN